MAPKKKPENEFLREARTPTVGSGRHAVRADRYDIARFKGLLEQVRDFRNYRDKLADSHVGDEYAYDVWQDTFLSLMKVDPRLVDADAIRPDHLISRRVMDELLQLGDHKELRTYTAGDDIAAAMACQVMEPELERLYDRLEREMDQAQELQEVMEQIAAAQEAQQDLDEMFNEWTENNPDETNPDLDQARQDLQDKLDELQEQADALGKSLEEMLAEAAPEMRQMLRAASRAASQQQQSMENMSQMLWGDDPGELQRLSAQERMDLARRTNTPKFQKVAELFGPLRRMAMAEQRRRVNYAHEEIFDIELGADIPQLLPTELMKLGDEIMEMEFLLRYSQQRLLQFAMRGNERVARGGIVYVHDGSSSMSGAKEMWAKALGLALLHIAIKQKREFCAIQFGGPGQVMLHDFRDGEISSQRVLDFAEFFYNGGTAFEGPLNLALDLLDEEHKRTGALKSDIVFVSDGEAGVSRQWMERWEAERSRLDFTCWGVNLDNDWRSQPQYSICAGQVATVHSLLNGNDVRHIFNGV